MSFPNHVATVSAYLDAYRKELDSARREVLSARFSRYLILACWKKMRSRVSHWAVVGIICNLALAPHETLLRMKVQPSTQADKRLAMNLMALNNVSGLDGPLSYYQPPYANEDASISCLLRACEDSRPLYTKDTAIDFHRLLVGTLLAYASLVEGYYKASPTERAQIDKHLSISGTLLRLVLYSDAFDCHMKSLVQANPPILSFPMSDHIDEYVDFARDRDIRCQRPYGSHQKSGSGGEGEEKLGSSMAGESKQAGVGDDNKLGSTSDVIGENKDEDKTFDTTNEVDNILSHTGAPGHSVEFPINSWHLQVKLFLL